MFQKKNIDTEEIVNKIYALNEVFLADRNIAGSSIYHLNADGKYKGKFKASGLMLCTGTGSTGWLASAKRTTDENVISGLR